MSNSLADSITSESELLTMSYARDISKAGASSISDESCTEQEREQIATLPKSTFSSFVSPAERKRRQLEKLEAMKKDSDKEHTTAPLVAAAAPDPELDVEKTLNDATDDHSSEEDSDVSDESSEEDSDDSDEDTGSSSSSSTSRISNRSASHNSSASNQDKNAENGKEKRHPEFVVPLVASVAAVSTVDVDNTPETTVPAVEDEDASEIPPESDMQKRKRAAIQGVMKDISLSQVERNRKIQDIIAGNADLESAQVAAPTQAASVQAPVVVPTAAGTTTPGATANVANDTPHTAEHVSEMPRDSRVHKHTRSSARTLAKDSSLSQAETKKKSSKAGWGVAEVPPPRASPYEAPPAATRDMSPLVAVAETSNQTVVTTKSVALDNASRNISYRSAYVTESSYCVPTSTVDASKVSDAKSQQGHPQQRLESNSEQHYKERKQGVFNDHNEEEYEVSAVGSAAAISYETQLYEQKRMELEMQLEQKRKEMEMQMENQRKALELEQQRKIREMELQQQLELEMARQRRLELEQQQREMEFQAEQRRIREEAENRRQAERHRMEMERLRDLERQQSMRQMQQDRERQAQEELDRQREMDMSRAVGNSENASNLSAVAAARNLMSRMNFFRPPRPNSQARSLRFDGVDDEELNWRLDCYASLSDFTIVVHRALPGPFAPDFDVVDRNAIDVVIGTDGSPLIDVYYVHKVMLAVGHNRSELLGRRIRDAESTSREGSPDGHSSDVNVHETVLLEGAADVMGVMLDFCYFPERPVDISVENAVPLLYLAQRYKIRALLSKAEEFVRENLESANAVHFLLDAYLYKLEDVLLRSIDVTASHFDDRIDFDPIYKLPTQLFRRIIASTSLKCDSELLSLVVYSYCGEHHRDEIDVEYFREVTRPKLMPELDSSVALMMLKFYVDLIRKEDENGDVMEVLQDDNLTNRCVSVIAKNWRHEICEPLMIDTEWEGTAALIRRNLPPREPASLHRLLPSQLQNRILERCILAAMDDTQVENGLSDHKSKAIATAPEGHGTNYDNHAVVMDSVKAEPEHARKRQTRESNRTQTELEELQQKAFKLEAELQQKSATLEEYKLELKKFRRVPGIHNFGSISKKEPTVIDKTTCTYSANPDHHFPLHRRGSKPPTQMPKLATEFENLGRENGYIYNDGHGELLPVYYYIGER
ncbi:hypothetical protein HJC23_003492 [Cyclotella cryptica]|uniref:BTB domain-containing protein n=1 Tax=Cyclotella cryptica TaxID=29204 RepID=A0ABD3QS02_9STRA|eukprot:CCRYP_002641-RA/>CCRYP_002641-RA protein AED:0.00 eAED:0.00 QI:772/-1/1/1/-1/1/1/390/1172